MEVAKILVNSTTGRCLTRKQIPARLVGGTVSVEFADSIWDRLNKTVVFRCEQSQPAEFDGKTAVIPWELLQQPGKRLYFGIWGNDPGSDLQIPLIEVPIGVVEESTNPDATPGADPTLPIWAQLQKEIEDLKQAGVSEEKIAQVVEEYLKKNPPTVTETDPTVPDWAKDEKKPTYTANEVGALSKEELSGAVNDALAQAKASGEFDGEPGAPGQDYVLTPADKEEIAEMAAGLVEIPDSGGNVAYDEAQNLTDAQKAQARDNIGAQPKGNYLTEVPEGYAKTEDIPTDAEIIQLIKDNAPESSGGGIAVTGATVGQTVKISAVDENGVPTAWESVDFPSGGSEKIVVAQTLLESGVIPSDHAAWGFYEIGLTLADIQEWEEICVELQPSTFNSYWSFIPRGGSNITWIQSTSIHIYRLKWVDSAHTFIEASGLVSGVGGGVGAGIVGSNITRNNSASNFIGIANWSNINPTTKMGFAHNVLTTVDIPYNIWGIVRKEA